MNFKKKFGKTIVQAFNEYHARNPLVYTLFKDYVFKAIQAGKKTISSKLIINIIRWEYFMKTNDLNSDFKINDAFHSRYSRLFVSEYPQYIGLFEFRALRSE